MANEVPQLNPHFIILREFLGGSETLDVSTKKDYYEFVWYCIGDEQEALGILKKIADGETYLLNGDDPEYIERYSLGEASKDFPIWKEPEDIEELESISGLMI